MALPTKLEVISLDEHKNLGDASRNATARIRKCFLYRSWLTKFGRKFEMTVKLLLRELSSYF